MKTPVTFAICGFGDRGSTYASMQQLLPEKMKVTAVADLDSRKVEKAKKLYDIPDENCFGSAEEMLEKGRLADVMCICTMDRQHVDHAIPAIQKGYHIILEKPISPEISKCRDIVAAAEKSDVKIIVCHVLRYTAFYNKLKEVLDSGAIGEIVSVCASENVGYWHQAHSFVRGNWRSSSATSPMILQKSCHDMDILMWLTGKKCRSVSSVGSTYLFKKENAPDGAGEFCLGGCQARDTCLFDAEKIYITGEKTGVKQGKSWPSSVLSIENTVESTYAALQNGQYGKCVYHCNNDVVDHQQTNLLMTDGSTLSFTMCAFTEDCYREFKAMGTRGEISADMKSNTIQITRFGGGTEIIDIASIASDLKGHGGGDSGMISDFLDMLIDQTEPKERTTTLQASMESHFVALAAEQSRLQSGAVVELDTLRKTF